MKKMFSSLLRFLLSGILLISLAACGFTENSSEPPITDPSVPAIKVSAGQVITFANGEAGGAQNGWSFSETNGTWSNSDKTVLYLDYDSSLNDGMNLVISMLSFVIDKNPTVSASIKANGEPVGGVNFDLSKSAGDVLVKISKEILSKREELCCV